MELILYFITLSLYIFDAEAHKPAESVTLVNNTRNVRLSYLRTIEEDLLHQPWEEHEKPCLRQLLRVITNVRNSTLWAAWIWDSMQFPVGQLYGTRLHLGNYDQCMNLPWEDHPEFKTQYCLAELHLSELDPEITNIDLLGSLKNYIRHSTKYGLTFNNLIWGICAPVACKSDSITKLTEAMFRSTHLGQIDTHINISVNSANCQISGAYEGMGFQEYFVLLLIISLIILTSISTSYVNLKGSESKSTVLILAKALDLKSNAERLIEAEDLSIRSVLGIRMTSICLILLSHLWFIKNIIGVNNAVLIDKKRDNPFQCIRFTADMVVDTFFMLSGLLLALSLIGKKGKSCNIFNIIAKRYVRLMCSVLLVILIFPIVLLNGEPAPLVKYYLQQEVDLCTKNWWKTVLMIGNYGDTENMCYPILWSLACDFHLFIVGIVIYCIYQKNKRTGIKAYIICAVASVVIPVIHGYVNHSPAVVTFDFRMSDNLRKTLVADPAYVHTHLRAGPYFVGLAIGYLMAMFHPKNHRNFMSKKPSILAFMIFLFLFSLLITLCGIYHGREYGPLEGAMFSVIRRNSFAALVGILIIICEYGTLPFISSVLSWKGRVPLSKLSYGIYLTHFMLILRFVSRTRTPLRSDAFQDIYSTFGLLVFTTTMSFFMWLLWEAPIVNLFDMFLKRYPNKIEQNGKPEKNEIKDRKLDTAAEKCAKNVHSKSE